MTYCELQLHDYTFSSKTNPSLKYFLGNDTRELKRYLHKEILLNFFTNLQKSKEIQNPMNV